MASRLGPSWLNQVQQLAGPTHAGRFSRFAVLVDRSQCTGAGARKLAPTRS